jgi:hypothetical protein
MINLISVSSKTDINRIRRNSKKNEGRVFFLFTSPWDEVCQTLFKKEFDRQFDYAASLINDPKGHLRGPGEISHPSIITVGHICAWEAPELFKLFKITKVPALIELKYNEFQTPMTFNHQVFKELGL